MIWFFAFIAIAVVIFFLFKSGNSKQEALGGEILAIDSLVVKTFNGITGVTDGERWKAVYVVLKNTSLLAKLGLAKDISLLRVAQKPVDQANRSGQALDYITYELDIPTEKLKKNFKKLQYIQAFQGETEVIEVEGKPMSVSSDGSQAAIQLDDKPASGSIELMVDGTSHRVATQLSALQAFQVVSVTAPWLRENMIVFGWEGLPLTKQEFRTMR
jgi:hypothetical protein